MDKLIEFSIQNDPVFVKYVVLTALTIMAIVSPIVFMVWLVKFINRDRYVFAKSDDRLYRLDTITGKTSAARGFVFQEVDEWDSVSSAEKKNSNNKSPRK